VLSDPTILEAIAAAGPHRVGRGLSSLPLPTAALGPPRPHAAVRRALDPSHPLVEE
jgi:hypothetical protein